MSGANNVLPNVPSFGLTPSLAQLQALSYAVSFLVDQDVRPTWHFFLTGTVAVSAATWTSINYNHVAYDSDGVYDNVGAIVVTQGRYVLEACIQMQATSTKDNFVGAFFFQAGANNPHFTTGSQQYFGYCGSNLSQTGSANATNALCLASITPMICYPGDFLHVQVYSPAAHTIDYNQNTSYIQGRFATNYTGYFVNTGS